LEFQYVIRKFSRWILAIEFFFNERDVDVHIAYLLQEMRRPKRASGFMKHLRDATKNALPLDMLWTISAWTRRSQ
jgi:hypothetical protein